MVDAVFNILNVLVRFGLVVFLIRKYAVGRIYQAIANQKQSMNLLQEQQIKFKELAAAAEQTMRHQEALYQELQDKFLIWQQSVARSLEKDQQTCEAMHKKMQLQFEMKQQAIITRRIMQEELPILIEEIRQEMHDSFQKNPEVGKKYITSLLHAIHE